LDGYFVPIVSGAKFGAYILCDGTDGYVYASSDDFNFGTGDFTISWWEHRININANNDSVSRDFSSAFPGFVLGRADGTTMKAYFSSNGSSWDIGNARDMGPVKVREWTHYLISRKDGMFYIFVDGELTDNWYSTAAILSTTNPLAFARSNLGYCFTAFDDIYIIKGRAEHTKPFSPPQIQKSIYLDEDYWGNLSQDRISTDITADITVAATYGTEAVTLTITNANASAGYVFAQVRGRGVYRYNPDERRVEDAASVAARGYRNPLTINQIYQQSAAAGEAEMTDVIANEHEPRTELDTIEFQGNRSHAYMAAALHIQPGDLVQISHTASGVDASFYVQSVDKTIMDDGIVNCSWLLRQSFDH
jgi:hypothetical protein